MALLTRRHAALAVVALVLIGGTGACSGDDGDDDAPATTSAPSVFDAEQLAALERTLDASTDADDVYQACLVARIEVAVTAGQLTVDDVQAWSDGEAFDGPVQALVGDPEVVSACLAAEGTDTTQP